MKGCCLQCSFLCMLYTSLWQLVAPKAVPKHQESQTEKVVTINEAERATLSQNLAKFTSQL